MKINWYKFSVKREFPIKEFYKDFKECVEDYDPLIRGNSIWGSGNLDEWVEPIQTYYCSINSEVSQDLAQIFLSKYSATSSQRPNPDSVGWILGDMRTFEY